MAKEIKAEPDFLQQAFAIIEANYSQDTDQNKHGMTIADHKLICHILDAHENYVNTKIIDVFVEQIAKYYGPILARLDKLDEIADDMVLIKKDILILKEKQSSEEYRLGQLEAWALRKKPRIEKLEEQMITIKPESIRELTIEIEETKPYLMIVGRFLKWWNWKKAIFVIILFIIFICAIIWGAHQLGFVSQQTQPKSQVGQTYDELLMNYSSSARGKTYDPFAKDTVK
jgi:hypothetical protein